MTDLPGIDISQAMAERYLLPGDLLVSGEPARVTTILGSCVSLCLFDKQAGIGGINHFLLPGMPPATDGEPLRWSVVACRDLYSRVLAAGARAARLEAKVFGGSCSGSLRVTPEFRIGERNAEAVREWLAARGIAITASDTGGRYGRKLLFETHTGRAWVKALMPASVTRNE